MIHVSTRPPKQDPCIITGVSKIPEPRLPAHLGGLQDGSSALSGQLGVLLAKDTKHSIWKRETREKGNSKTTGSNLDQQTGFKNRILTQQLLIEVVPILPRPGILAVSLLFCGSSFSSACLCPILATLVITKLFSGLEQFDMGTERDEDAWG